MASQPAPMIGRNAELARQWEQWLGDHGRSSPHVVLISGPAGSGRRTLASRIARDLNPHWDLSEALDAMGAASDAVIAHFRREIGWIRSQRYTALGQSVASMTGLAPAITLLDVLGKVVDVGAQLSEDRGGIEPVPVAVLIDWDAEAKGAERLSKWLELHAHGRMQFWLVVVVSSDLNRPSAFDRYLHEALDPEIPTSPSLCLRTSPWWDRAAIDTYAAVRLRSQNIAAGVLAALWAGAVGMDDPPEKRAIGRVVALLDRWVARGAVVEERGRWQLARRPGVSGWFGKRLPSPGWDELVGDLAGDLAQEAALVLAAWGATPDEGVGRSRRIPVPLGALEAAVGVEAVEAMLPRGLRPRDGGPPYWHVHDGALVWADPLVALALAEKAHGEASIRGAAFRQTVDAVLWIAERSWQERQRWAGAEAAWREHANLRLEGLPDLGTGEYDDALAYLDWLRWGARWDPRQMAPIVYLLHERFGKSKAYGLHPRAP